MEMWSYMGVSTLISLLFEDEWPPSQPNRFTVGKDPQVPICEETFWAPELV
jgi:hypothetical protein